MDFSGHFPNLFHHFVYARLMKEFHILTMGLFRQYFAPGIPPLSEQAHGKESESCTILVFSISKKNCIVVNVLPFFAISARLCLSVIKLYVQMLMWDYKLS